MTSPWADTATPSRRRTPLPEQDKSALSLAFGGIESLLFLGSNFGASLERLSQLPKRRRETSDGVGPDGHTKLAYGIKMQTMSVKPTHSVRISDEPWKLEAYSCWTNHNIEEGSDALRAREAHEALVWLAENGHSWVATVLHKMYGGTFPAEESNALSFMGELAPLACDTPVVLTHAATLTRRLRASLGSDRVPKHISERGNTVLETWVPSTIRRLDRKEYVAPRTALWDLLSGEKRPDREKIIREEALDILENATKLYLVAKGAD